MEFLKNHFEKLILGVILLALMATAVILSAKMGSVVINDNLNTGKPGQPPVLPREYLDDLTQRATSPPKWGPHDAPLFISLIRWWHLDNAKRTWALVTGKVVETVGEPCSGIPASWFADNGLNPKKPGICEEDSDGDG